MNPHNLTYLKVKQKHIGTEKGIIRHQELKWKEKARQARLRAAHSKSDLYLERVGGLYAHRMNEVRTEARATNIAYGYLRGRTYEEIENKVYDHRFGGYGVDSRLGKKNLWTRVFKMVSDFGDLDYFKAAEAVKAWRKDHIQYRELNWDDLH